MTNHTNESSLLAPHDPAQDSDDWPIFTLTNVDVFDPSDHTSTPANLLHADVLRPLTLTGTLQSLPKAQAHLYLQPSSQRLTPIEVTEVRQFAYGQYEDGEVDIWAGGRAGWFTVRPSRGYRRIYQEMIEAVKLLYFAADLYKGSGAVPQQKKRGRPSKRSLAERNGDLSANDVFERYSAAQPDACPYADVAAELFYKYRHFLMASMLAGKEGVPWSTTPLFKHMEHKFADEIHELRQRKKANAAYIPPTQSDTPQPRAGRKRKRGSGVLEESRLQTGLSSASPDPVGLLGPPARPGRYASRDMRDGSQVASALTPHRDSAASTPDTESDATARQTRKGKGKSALRPKPSKFVVSKAESDFGNESLVTPLHGQGREEPQAIAGAEASISDASGGDIDEGIDIPSDDESVDELSLDLKMPFQPRRSFLKAQGQGDTWTCPLDGCMHRVYAASEPASQAMIEEHYRMHTFDDDARVQLVRKMQAPWLPVGRLMGRVQELASKGGLPPPVAQRY